MPELDAFTRASQRLADRMSAAAEEAKKAKGVPFGMEKVTADVEARAFAAMNREGKAKFLQQHSTEKDPKGLEYAMKVLQREKKNA